MFVTSSASFWHSSKRPNEHAIDPNLTDWDVWGHYFITSAFEINEPLFHFWRQGLNKLHNGK